METIIDSIMQAHDSSVIVGPGDDARIYLMSGDQAITETVDIITPVIDDSLDMIDAGKVPLGTYNNLKFLEGKVAMSSGLTEEKRLILSDPQTSGGLLITLPEERLAQFQDDKESFHIIGRAEKGTGKIIVNV